MLKKYLSLSVFGLATLAPAAFATTVLAPGTGASAGQAPDTFALGTTSMVAQTSNQLAAPTVAGSYSETVYTDSNNVFCSGCLDFVITVSDTLGTIERITSSSFSGFKVDAGVMAGSSTSPTDVERSDNTDGGSVVGFGFTGGSNLTAGSSTNKLVIETNATSFTTGYLSIQDGTSASGVAFAPTAAPEPMSMSLLGGGLVGLGVLRLRRRNAKTN
jgi:hypothetical protein